MSIPVKNDYGIEKMREVNSIVAKTFKTITPLVKEGISTKDIDIAVEQFILSQNAKPNFKNYRGYPASCCISINDEVIHGIPSANRIIKNGDIVSIDLGAVKDGFHGDAARSFLVGEVSEAARKIVEVAKECFYKALEKCRVGYKIGDISNAVQIHAEKHGYSVVKNYTGHGIGKRLHEDPAIPNYGKPDSGVKLKAGATLAIEPMINQGKFEVIVASDNWTVKTKDGRLSAHYENTVLITDADPEILTEF